MIEFHFFSSRSVEMWCSAVFRIFWAILSYEFDPVRLFAENSSHQLHLLLPTVAEKARFKSGRGV